VRIDHGVQVSAARFDKRGLFFSAQGRELFDKRIRIAEADRHGEAFKRHAVMAVQVLCRGVILVMNIDQLDGESCPRPILEMSSSGVPPDFMRS
jgi:hypothetical protein